MKKTAILMVVLALAVSCFSQPSEFQKKIVEKDQQIGKLQNNLNDLQNDLQKDIHNEWQRIEKDSLTKNPTECFNKLKAENRRWGESIRMINNRIKNLKNDSWVKKLHEYYQNGKIDQLYAQTDLQSLSTHKDILGKDHPKVMDELEVLLKCSELLKKEYNANENNDYQEQLNKVSECDTKKSLQYLLSQQKGITDEVNEWIKDDKNHTLFGMKKFYKELEYGYKVSFEEQYPYLAQKVREKVMEKMRQHSSEK